MTDPLHVRHALQAVPSARRVTLLRSLDERTRTWIDRDFGWRAHDNQKPPPGDWRVWAIIAGRGFGKTRAGAEWVLDLVRPSLAPPLQGRGVAGRSIPRIDLEQPGSVQPETGWGMSNALPLDSPHPNPVRPVLGRPGDDLGRAPEGEGLRNVRIALVAATIDEARAVMVEGASGILACAKPGEVLDWCPGTRTLRFRGGAEATLFSGASPEKLRGPEHDFAWCDELCKWPRAEETWNNLQLGLRRGERPRVLITTTPRSGPLLDSILDQPDVVRRNGSTYDNPFTAAAYKEAVTRMYGGTRLGAQELEGVLLRDVEGSLWPGELVERQRINPPHLWGGGGSEASDGGGSETAADVEGFDTPLHHRTASGGPPPHEWGGFQRIVIGVDPPASANGTCGIVVCGTVGHGEAAHGYVIADESVSGASPEGWARAVAAAFARLGADRVVAEVNQGGDMVASTLKAVSAGLPVRMVRAMRGKAKRAEPVAALFEDGRAWFCGRFPELEAELGGLTTGGRYEGSGSPDRADAMVWALWALMVEQQAEPRVRVL